MIAVLIIAAAALTAVIPALLLAATGGPALMTHTTHSRPRTPKEG
ncbi:hypothetical protein [Nocardiopsis algeriensis]|uniref:Uncharacterized protein n=1 Tax=Nocardiopsis algeriensis TaxID=1478215 RepID=A0A841J1J5_9ACTN|nr:hypothetical protein [Nocardiopsis algeriensis]MBB6122201.1 hypothetical protein [Nocardiopsis algeriensis]